MDSKRKLDKVISFLVQLAARYKKDSQTEDVSPEILSKTRQLSSFHNAHARKDQINTHKHIYKELRNKHAPQLQRKDRKQ